MYNILLIVQILVALGIIGLVLVQHGKGADAGAAFGGGGGAGGASGSVFGSRGAGNFLSRTTAILAVVFFLNSMGLAWIVSHRGDGNASSLVDSAAPVVEETIPAAANDVLDVPDSSVPEVRAESDAVPEVPTAAPATKEAVAVPAAATTAPKTEATNTNVPASVAPVVVPTETVPEAPIK